MLGGGKVLSEYFTDASIQIKSVFQAAKLDPEWCETRHVHSEEAGNAVASQAEEETTTEAACKKRSSS